MTLADIEAGLTDIFRTLFKEPALVIRRDMTAADVARWDSLTHVEMIATVEKHFAVRFKLKDVVKMRNVGDLIDAIAAQKGL